MAPKDGETEKGPDIGKSTENASNNQKNNAGGWGYHENPARNYYVKAEGHCEALKQHIYDCSNGRQVDTYSKTTKEIADYVGREYKYGGDIRRAVVKLTRPT